MNTSRSVETVRLFVAVETPSEIKRQIEQVQDQLRESLGSMEVRWSSPEQFHLTLKFLGSVQANRCAELIAALQRSAGDFSELALQAEGIGFFPNRHAPRVIWVGVLDSEGCLAKLHEAVERAVQSFTSEPAEEKFLGHITLARVKGLQGPERKLLTDAVAKVSERKLGAWRVKEFRLMRSELGSTGARHEAMARVPFGVQI